MRISDWSSDVCASDLVFDDGAKTYVLFPADVSTSELPPLFLIGERKRAELVNYRVSGRYIVVDRLFAIAELPLGTKKQKTVRIERMAARSTRPRQRSRTGARMRSRERRSRAEGGGGGKECGSQWRTRGVEVN